MDWVLDEWGNDGKSYIKWDALNEVCAGVSEDGAFCTFPHAFKLMEVFCIYLAFPWAK